MKYSKWIGLLSAAVIIAVCYVPWIYVPSVKLEIGGMHASGPQSFGRPGLMNIIMTVGAALMFLLPFIWAKRTNLFFCAFNIAWSIRNYILLTKCYGGECPEIKAALYILLAASLAMLVMSMIPDVKLKEVNSQ